MQDRCAGIEKSTMSEHEKKKWKLIMTTEFMSSEESDDDSSCLVKRPLPWRSARASNLFHELDALQAGYRSGLAQRQRKSRILATESSTRPLPTGQRIPSWAIDSRFKPAE